jgi:hypothetical protein
MINNNCDNYNVSSSTRNRKNGKRIEQYDLEDNFIKSFEKISFAETELGINNANISSCLKGRLKTAGGYKWKFADNIIEGEIWALIPNSCIPTTNDNKYYISDKGRFKKNDDISSVTIGVRHKNGKYFVIVNKKSYRISRLQENVRFSEYINNDIVIHNNSISKEIRKQNTTKAIEKRKEKNNGILRNKRSKYILCLDKHDNIIKEYSSIAEVKADGFTPTSVYNCCQNTQNFHKNKKFQYKI